MSRAVLWVLAGFAALCVAMVAVAPELLGDLGDAGGFAVIAFAAGVPGLVVLLVLAATRKGRHDQPGAGRPSRPTAAPNLTVDQVRRDTDARPDTDQVRRDTDARPDDATGGRP